MIIVFDLESTCWETKEDSGTNNSETIQIGAVKLDLLTGRILDTFSSLVRPKQTENLSKYCVDLTGITTDGVMSSEYFDQVYPKFVKFCGSRHKHTLVAWGSYDGRQLDKDCNFNGIKAKHPGHYINASLLFKERYGLHSKVGLVRAVEYLGLEFEGLQHDAFWDALNTAKIFLKIMGVELVK